MKRGSDSAVLEVQRWFAESVTYEGEPYVIDYEQATAVADESLNTIVAARAGSGKTRTLVAKIVYLVAKRGVGADEIMAFVFNANAAREINERLSKMRVEGEVVIGGEALDGEMIGARGELPNGEAVEAGSGVQNDGVVRSKVQIASTFHAFSRRIVYKVCKGEKKCGKILAGEKEDFVLLVVQEMMNEAVWDEKIWWFVRGDLADEERRVRLSDEEVRGFAGMMTTFINRAQQKYLGGERSLAECAREYLGGDVGERERLFVELGVECFRRYHWYLLDEKARCRLCVRWDEPRFVDYGTDFNLVVSWASKLILSGRNEVRDLLAGKKYILIDEYQDFSQLFLAAVEAIRSVAVEARLFVVGDDWQAINRFAGSEVEYFKNFERYFGGGFGEISSETRSGGVNDGVMIGGGCARYEIGTNYRCDKAVVETARKFMRKAMGEKGNFRAFSRKYGEVKVVNPRETEVGYALVPYDLRVSVEDRIIREAVMRMGKVVKGQKMVRYLKTVINVVRANVGAGEILLLHRNNEMNLGGVSLAGFGEGLKWGLDRLGVLSEVEFDDKVKLMTMHKSKGLEAEVVVILEADEGVIPKTHPDTILYGLFGETSKVALDDQKRLFYVAMTRAKKRLYIVSEGGGFVKYLGRGVER